jgi:formate hydrogenlyase subunit 4
MTLKQKAILQTVAIIAGIILGSLLVNVILIYASTQIIQYACGAILVGFLVYSIYGIVLARLESNERLDQISSRT